MLSLKVPPPPPWPHIAKIEEGQPRKTLPGQDQKLEQIEPGKGETPEQIEPGKDETPEQIEPDQVESGKTTIQKLSEVVNTIRIPKIEQDWNKCISEIEKVIKIQPTHQEYKDVDTRHTIEKYKDRLANDLYSCKINLKKKEEEDKILAQKKREIAQENFERGLAMKYNLAPQSQSSPQQPSQPSLQPSLQPSPQPSLQPSSQPSLQYQPQQASTIVGEEKGEKGEKGIFSTLKSYIVGDKEEEVDDEEKQREEENEKEEMIDAVNLYLKSAQDSAIPQVIDRDELKKIDNVIDNYKELIENHDILDEKFSKYKETQKLKNFKDNSLINDKQDTIENLTAIIKKLEKRLNTYKRNAEKKFIAQEELNLQEIEKIKRDKNSENRKVHQFMQDILNERIDNANKVIKELMVETEEGTKQLSKQKTKKVKKRTKKKEKKKKKKNRSKSKRGA